MSNQAEITELAVDVRERVRFLRELGVPSIKVRLREAREAEKTKALNQAESSSRSAASQPMDLKPEVPRKPADRPAGSRLASLPSLSNRKSMPFFDKYNPQEKRDDTCEAIKSAGLTSELFEIAQKMPEPTETVEQIRAEIGKDCTRCKLSTLGRSRVVNSVGNVDADLMFVGEAPGADEDRLGEPFVGRAGQLLTDIIEKGLLMRRADVFIGNINRCRPPGNRAPEQDESVVCKPFLLREIAVVRPRVIVVLGATAAQNLLETKTPIGKLRGHFHDYLGVKVMPTFHPAYLLRDPHKKREVWEDMKLVRDYLSVNK